MRLPIAPSLVALLPLLASADLITIATAPASVSAEPTPASTTSFHSAVWSPMYTRVLPISIPIPTSDELFHNDLRVRAPEPAPQATGQGEAAVLQPTQLSPITTYEINSFIAGTAVQVQVVYTQLFQLPLQQWPAAQAGAIGLGTIQGTIGVVKTNAKRDVAVQTQAPVALLSHETMTLSGDAEVVEAVPHHDDTEGAASDELLEHEHEQAVAELQRICDKSRRKTLQNKTGKNIDSSAGSALALILAIAAMVVA